MELTGYNLVNLDEMVKALGRERTQEILAEFSCPPNTDIEYFLKTKAMEFSVQNLSKTQLVIVSHKGKPVICGYFTLCNKSIEIVPKSLSRNKRDQIKRYCTLSHDTGNYTATAYLIAQLGKNYTNGYCKLITGDELLLLATQKIQEVRHLIGGGILYLECEDNPKLISFYKENGFCDFGKRSLDKDEEDRVAGRYLIQMMKCLNGIT